MELNSLDLKIYGGATRICRNNNSEIPVALKQMAEIMGLEFGMCTYNLENLPAQWRQMAGPLGAARVATEQSTPSHAYSHKLSSQAS